MSLCPCASGKNFSECCEPIIKDQAKAGGPEALMRARYTAFAVQDIDFLRESLMPGTRQDFDEQAVRQWAQAAQWPGVEIVTSELAADGESGVVHFIARYTVNGKPQEFEEKAIFQKQQGLWYYVDGEVRGQTTYRRESPKIGRNDPCPCGSGKKYKKCCG
ncbi:YchJ family protein [Desulfocurvibacter africanus]|uniref:YchJ family protein n=1 Tax=Desulfocurvibacter africanus TaxID=873 RepID=UPI0004131891|nr:YchJ family protein [Desulfocurvibacter africanus]